MKLLGLLTFCLILPQVFGQQNSNIALLVLEQVNELRDSLHLPKLSADNILDKAGEDHAYYISQKGKLTHFQKTFSKETPSERVLYYNGNRTYIGENVAYVPISKKKKSKELDYQKVSKALFTSWLNSPRHYENMISPDYTKMGLGIHLSKDGKVYGAQVFSSNEIRLPRSFNNSNLAWGVRPGEITCKDDEQVYETMFFANRVVREGRNIYFEFHDLDFFKHVIHNENDGLAIDVVLREQLPCSKENQFHISKVYDGEMQRPIYKHDIFRNNISSNPKKIKVKIGEIPKHLSSQQWDANVIIINNNKLCDYSVPMDVSSDIYPLLQVDTYYELGKSDLILKKQVRIEDTIQVELLYERSKGTFFAKDEIAYYKLLKAGRLANSIKVDCYASVEGKEWYNLQLLDERKESALKLLHFCPSENIQFSSKENWKLMNQQINDLNISELKGKTPPEVKYFLKKNPSSFYDSLLFEQRKTKITAAINTTLDIESMDDYEIGHYYDSTLVISDLPLNKMLYDNHIKPNHPLRSDIFDSLSSKNELKTNLLAAGAIDYRNGYYDSVALETFLSDVNTKNSRQLFNYGHFLTRYWFSRFSNSYELKGVASTITPEELFQLLEEVDESIVDSVNLSRLKMNVLLSGIHYYVVYDNWGLVNAYFNKISDLVKSGGFTMQEAKGLALFCNHFHKFKQSIEILDPFFDANQLDEDGIFLLAETSHLRKGHLSVDRYHQYMNAAKKINKRRYCNWLDKRFQIQRDEYLKKDFCKSCQ